MNTSSVYFADLYKEIGQTVFNSPEKEQATGPGNTGTWLKKYRTLLSDFDNELKALAPYLEVPSVQVVHDDEAVFFCANQSLIGYLQLIEGLINEHFPTVQKISFSLDYDPETSDKWVNADIEITGDVSQVIEWEDAFVADWVSEAPYPERNKIRLSCDIM